MMNTNSAMVHLVDDEAPVRAALEFLLASHALPVRSYVNGAALLDAQAAGQVERGCILLDVRMEPLSGCRFTMNWCCAEYIYL